MNPKIKSDLILLLASVIWGFAFVAQRMGMEFVGPFTFTAVRFTLGTLVLLPFLFFRSRRKIDSASQPLSLSVSSGSKEQKKLLLLQFLLGLILFGGISFQQYGMKYTTAGNGGFITGFYVVLVPLAGLFHRQRPGFSIWVGVILAVAGLYLLSVTSDFTVNPGDYYVAVCALFWTAHVLLVAYLAPRTDPIRIAVVQFIICSVLSWIVAAGFEEIRVASILDAWGPVLYGGILSVGIGYTLQIVAQQKAHPAYASIILSMESVFAVLGGWLILNEYLTNRSFTGCLLMLTGMIFVQVMGSTKVEFRR